jgi:hypothetical protein
LKLGGNDKELAAWRSAVVAMRMDIKTILRAGTEIQLENLCNESRASENRREALDLMAHSNRLRGYRQVELQEYEGMVGPLAVGVFGIRRTERFGSILVHNAIFLNESK